jgi:hypothetical protein
VGATAIACAMPPAGTDPVGVSAPVDGSARYSATLPPRPGWGGGMGPTLTT